MHGMRRECCRDRLLFLAMDHPVEYRQHNQREERGTEDPADDHGCERPLHLRARAGGDGHGHESECGDERSHEDWAEAGVGTFEHGVTDLVTSLTKLIEIGHKHQPIENRNPAERNEPDRGGDTERHSAYPECGNAAGECEGIPE